jgi:hypothetical protein
MIETDVMLLTLACLLLSSNVCHAGYISSANGETVLALNASCLIPLQFETSLIYKIIKRHSPLLLECYTFMIFSSAAEEPPWH